VNQRDASCATVAVGLLTLWMALTDAMLKYLKPSMRPWLVVAGAALVGIGAYGFTRSHSLRTPADDHGDGHDDGEWHHRSRVGWFLVLPIVVVIAVGTQSLGSFAAGRAGSRSLPEFSFDIAGYAQDRGESIPALQVLDVSLGAGQPGNRQYLLEHDVRLRGFVTRDAASSSGGFVLNRFLISCCAADATRLSVGMTGAGRVPADDAWVEVRARLLPARVNAPDGPRSVFRVRELRRVSAPADPYEVLR
jgi:uncharacterized repeat protein (TIGR03943 family)